LWVRERPLYSMRSSILSQCRNLRIGVTWPEFGSLNHGPGKTEFSLLSGIFAAFLARVLLLTALLSNRNNYLPFRLQYWYNGNPTINVFTTARPGGDVYRRNFAGTPFVQKIRILKFWNWITLPRPRPFKGRFMVRTQKGSILYVYTKFEVDSSIRSKVIEVPKFRNWVTWP